MKDSSTAISRAPVVLFDDQPIKAFLGLKRKQWPLRNHFQIIAREYLESMGAANVLAVNCFLKTKRGSKPSFDPNVINVSLKLRGQNGVDIIL